MAEDNPGEIAASTSPSESLSTTESIDSDALALAKLGYVQDLQRNYSVWSVLGVGFSLTNSWFGVSAALATGINSGGPVLYIYGIMIVGLISTCVGISLSELASAFPNAGGQYYWTSVLAPKKNAGFASFCVGWFAWAGSIFTSASVALAMGSATVGCWQLTHPGFVIQAWHVIVAYELVNAGAFLFNTYGRVLPILATTTLYVSLTSFAVILITVPATAPTHQSARFVFATFVNNTGWNNSGIAYIVGLINANWAFACLDCATHLAEEVPRPERMIPIAIMGTVAVGFTTSWLFIISMMFSLQSLTDVTNTATLVPILEIFYQAVGNRAGAVVLESFIILTGIGCLTASHTWQSRLCWSFARDAGVPGSRWLKEVEPKSGVPLAAHATSCVLVGLVGLLYLGSYTAFNSMVTACIVLLYVSYSIPVICLLVKGRNKIRHGPFWLGKIGLVANFVLLLWTLFTIVMYSFPAVMPAQAGNMNYVSVVYAVVIAIITIDWFARGRRQYCRQGMRKKSSAALLRRVNSDTIR